ncbi:MAG: hypothetical protein IAX21_08115 [Candidatus Bathyarchaeota archaeon]|nr:MAG: hypothetical protein IAX21_08115 [Candidatus Bathyarchaeota archaeon]
MKFNEIKDQDVLLQGKKIGHVENLYYDPKNWTITHFEIRFTKDAGYEILGSKMPIRNMVDISAVKKGKSCCTFRGLELDMTKTELHEYLRPPLNKKCND